MKPQSGQVAIQQALVKIFKLSYRDVEKLIGVNHRTVWQHVAANPGSNVAAWENRSKDVQEEAIEKARRLLETETSGHHLVDGGNDVSAA